MLKKIALAMIASLYLWATPAWAQEVTVDGIGMDRKSALMDARRSAVEQVVGTFVDSRTLVGNAIVELDNIYTRSHGFIGKVEILSEGPAAGCYQVRALINVQANPDPALLQQVQTVMALNDPRIAVIVLKDGAPGVHENLIESAIMEKLISLDFNHIVDPKTTAALQDARLLAGLYDGRPSSAIGSNYGADFVVLGKCSTSTRSISIPDFQGGYKETGLENGRTELTAKIIRLDTGEVLETFTVESSGVESDTARAAHEAVKNISTQAAAKVEEKFRRLGAKSNSNLRLTVLANDYAKIQSLAEDLRSIAGVQGVFIREHQNGRALVDIDSTEGIDSLLLLLRTASRQGFAIGTSGSASATLQLY